ncbi:MAG TPA: hypothetical protein VH165_27525, partial [Kofleriaceae bacterium]|nr:hypothetical protein [Kofleriaceae bacterium]
MSGALRDRACEAGSPAEPAAAAALAAVPVPVPVDESRVSDALRDRAGDPMPADESSVSDTVRERTGITTSSPVARP